MFAGKADSWYGDSGRNVREEHYDFEDILQSNASQAIKEVATIANKKTILKLRNESEISCGPKPKNVPACKPKEAPCLFNIRDDPCEYYNLADARPVVVHSLELTLTLYRASAVPIANRPDDVMSNPAYWNDTWVNWQDYPEIRTVLPYTVTLATCFMSIATITLVSLVALVAKQFHIRKLMH